MYSGWITEGFRATDHLIGQIWKINEWVKTEKNGNNKKNTNKIYWLNLNKKNLIFFCLLMLCNLFL